MKELKFEVGKAYQTRDGRKAVCLTTTLGAGFPIGMQVDSSIYTYIKNGKNGIEESNIDIVGEWNNKPVIDWATMPAWANFVAMDSIGGWRWYKNKPELFLFRDNHFFGNNCVVNGVIPKEYAPKWEGDWKDSLTERPNNGN
jgi:hypothetical protein